MGVTAKAIVGREKELGSLATFVEDVAAAPSGLLLEGPPGVGKTTLWEAGRDLAGDAGHRVLSARPAEVETAFSYAALGDLLLDTSRTSSTRSLHPNVGRSRSRS